MNKDESFDQEGFEEVFWIELCELNFPSPLKKPMIITALMGINNYFPAGIIRKNYPNFTQFPIIKLHLVDGLPI